MDSTAGRVLRIVQKQPPRRQRPIRNPRPCRCCRHGHAFADTELVVREMRTGRVVKRLVPVPGGYEEAANDDR